MKILAIDESTKSSGWAIFDDIKLIDYGCIKASSKDLIKRIYSITDEINKIIKQHPDIKKVILEEVRPEQEQKKSMKTQRALTFLQASIVFMVYDFDSTIEIEYIYPSEWRKTCGIKTGKGIHREVLKPLDIAFVKEYYNIDADDDTCDAICIGHAYINKDNNEINWE